MTGQTVVVSVLADTKHFSRAFKKLGDETGLSKLSTGAKALGGLAKKAALSVLGVGTAVAGLALKGGFERALNIEDAQAALRGLGHSTESIEQIMDSALKSVKGTAFGLGDAATIASTAVAAGIKPGEELTRKLKLTANSAALAKTGLGEMGSILNKVWTAGRVQTQELNQLADRGIPIWTKLAERYGVNAGELRKMVSAGKVDAETFASVLEETVGTAADAMGKTTRGSWQNMLAAFSRGGESFLKGVFPLFKQGLGGITQLADNIAPYAEKAGAALAGFVNDKALPALRDLGSWIKTEVLPRLKDLGKWIAGTLVPALRDFGSWVVRNKDWLAAIAVTIGTVVAGIKAYQVAMAAWKVVQTAGIAIQTAWNAVMAANPIGLIVLAVAALTAGLAYFFTQTETGKRAWQAFTDFLEAAWETIKAAFNAGAEAVGTILGKAWAVIKTIWSYSPLGLIVTNWDKILGFFKSIPDKVRGTLARATDVVKTIFSYTPIGLIVTNWDTILGFFKSIPDKVKGAFTGAGRWLWDAGKDAVQGLLNGAGSLLGKIGDFFLSKLPGWIVGPFKKALGIRSPSKVFAALGRNTVAGLEQGLGNVAGVRRTMRNLSATVSDGFDPTLTLDVNANGRGGGNTYQITVQALTPTAEIGRVVVDAVKRFERVNGVRP